MVASVVLALCLVIGAIVVDLGVFFEHRRVLQTKADAAALAGAGKWAFPCEPSIDAAIDDEARRYLGWHTKADSTPYSAGTSLNDQVGGTDWQDIHAVLNATQFWDDAPPEPVDYSDGSGPVCDSLHLDVKVTEKNVGAFFGLFTPDVKAKARVEIQQVLGINGLLPVAVRVPEPRSIAAVFFDESNGSILAVSYLNKQDPPPPFGIPTNLTRWTTSAVLVDGQLADARPASFVMPGARVGVAVATSFFPPCASVGEPRCFEDSGWGTIDQLCRQGTGRIAQCFYATGTGASQTVPYGLQTIRSFVDANVGVADPPALESVWFVPDTCGYQSLRGAYFNAISGSCGVGVRARVDVGGDRDGGDPLGSFDIADDVEVRVAGGACSVQFSDVSCELRYDNGVWRSRDGTAFDVLQLSRGNGLWMRVRLKDTSVGAVECTGFSKCEFFFGSAADPVHRTFVGDDESSGPVKYMTVVLDDDDNGIPDTAGNDETNSQRAGTTHRFYVDVGVRTALAADQAEPAYALSLKGSQSATVDCDPAIGPTKGEVVQGCAPFYRVSPLTIEPPCPTAGSFWTPPSPFDTRWPPYECVLTQTGNPRQLLDGFSERVLGAPNAKLCPVDNPAAHVAGRNYWQNANNLSGAAFAFPNLRDDDPRLVTLFLTAYNSFTGNGNERFPIIGFGTFYITGWGAGRPGGGLDIEDPCPGNTPPPDIIVEAGGGYVWGHFVVNVTPANTGGGSGDPCDPGALTPCVAVLVE